MQDAIGWQPSQTGAVRVDVSYLAIAAAVEPTGMVARGGFVDHGGDATGDTSDSTVRSVVMIGNIGGTMWPQFRAQQRPVSNPLDDWTRRTLAPIAQRLGARYLHPSDEPFQPFQRWAMRADDVWQSPIGLLIHSAFGLWHAYRGAFIFDGVVDDLPPVGVAANPCLVCVDQPCLTTCPVDAFGTDGYRVNECRDFVAAEAGVVGSATTDATDGCLRGGCRARRACPVNADGRYGPDQMEFHMRSFVGIPDVANSRDV